MLFGKRAGRAEAGKSALSTTHSSLLANLKNRHTYKPLSHIAICVRCCVKVGASLPKKGGQKRSELAISVVRSGRPWHTQNAPEHHVLCGIQSSRGRGYPRRPLTPPDVRFRIRRFIEHTGVVASYRAATPDLTIKEGLGEGLVHVACTTVPPRPAFAQALLDEAITLFVNGEPESAKLILRDLDKAPVGFDGDTEDLSQLRHLVRNMRSKRVHERRLNFPSDATLNRRLYCDHRKARGGRLCGVLYCTTNIKRLTVLGWACSFARGPRHAGSRPILRVPRPSGDGAEQGEVRLRSPLCSLETFANRFAVAYADL